MSMSVSVIIPVYNRRLLLEEAIASVKGQSFSDWELIIVDDGSDEDYSDLESTQISVLRQEHTGMAGQARNYGVSQSTGDYIAFLDSDDLWKMDKLEKQIAYMKEDPVCQILHTREQWLRNGEEVSQKSQKHQRAGDLYSAALKKCIIGPSTVMLKRKTWENLGGFDETLEIAEDYELWLRYTAQYSVAYIDEALVVKRAGAWEQLSEKYGQIEIFRIQALQRVLQKPGLSEQQRQAAKMELARKSYIYALGCTKRSKCNEAKVYRELGNKQGYSFEQLGLNSKY